LLKKHGHDDYTPVTEKRWFGIKIIVPLKRAWVIIQAFSILHSDLSTAKRMQSMLILIPTIRRWFCKFSKGHLLISQCMWTSTMWRLHARYNIYSCLIYGAEATSSIRNMRTLMMILVMILVM
jgi:hypothetical protein